MPAVRAHKPLRERCNVKLNVRTSIPHDAYDDYILTPDTPDTPPTRRGRRTACKPLAHTCKTQATKSKANKLTDDGVPRLYPIQTPVTEGLHYLHRLVPYIYVGFHKGRYLPYSMVSADGSLFTHIVKITHAAGSQKPGECDLQVDYKRGMLLLILVVPAPNAEDEEENNEEASVTVLTEHQLLLARDFLALALPYYAEAHPRADVPASALTSPDSVRVLITAPEGHDAEVDIMTIAACYLAWASEEPAKKVVQYIKSEADVPYIWQDAVKGVEAVEVIEKVARLGD